MSDSEKSGFNPTKETSIKTVKDLDYSSEIYGLKMEIRLKPPNELTEVLKFLPLQRMQSKQLLQVETQPAGASMNVELEELCILTAGCR